ncbi:MAG: glycosyl hydrolase, partial [Pseudomonadota bacterium]
MSGRIAAVDAVASDPNTIVVGASTGGLWMSHNGGLNWTPVFDDQPVASIGAVAINQGNPDIIWVGTGEGNVRNSTSVGGGVYKSVDGGKSFTYMGLGRTERIHRIALHPDNPNVAYVAALGQLWSENPERGIFKTNDGGKTWSKVLYVDEKTGATDIQMVPGNPNKLFAGMWQFRRWPYFFKSGGEGSGLYVSHDGGESWDKLTEDDGLPAGEIGRSAFAISKSNPSRVYALIEAEKSALARSDDGGKSWKLVNQDTDINDRPFYYNDLAVDPKDSNRVYRVGSRVKLSIDGGKTFKPIANPHGDQHHLWINPANTENIILANDGGACITFNGGQTWSSQKNQPTAQFYRVIADNRFPYHVYAGQQDNSTVAIASRTAGSSIGWKDWYAAAGGESAFLAFDPDNPRYVYGGSYQGNISVFDHKTETRKDIMAYPVVGLGWHPSEMKYRFNWNAPIVTSPQDRSVIYHAGNKVLKSSDRGQSWTEISP